MTAHLPEGALDDRRAPWNLSACPRCGADLHPGDDLCEACQDETADDTDGDAA